MEEIKENKENKDNGSPGSPGSPGSIEEPEYLKLVIPDLEEIISQNTYLRPGYKIVKWVKAYKPVITTYMYKEPYVKDYQEYIINYIYDHYTDYILKFRNIFKNTRFKEIFLYDMTHSSNRRDTTNCPKLVEDAIVIAINSILEDYISSGELPKFDDSKVYRTTNLKRYVYNENGTETIHYLLKPYKPSRDKKPILRLFNYIKPKENKEDKGSSKDS